MRLKKYPIMVSAAIFLTRIIAFLTRLSNLFIIVDNLRTVVNIWALAVYHRYRMEQMELLDFILKRKCS
jgi:hypothetical protein